jgi:hypothetical protein
MIGLCIAFLATMCKKPDIESNGSTNNNSNASAMLAITSKYLIFNTVNLFEQQMNRVTAMDSSQIATYRDSLRNSEILPLSDYLMPDDESFEGMERLTDILNKDGIVQVGDSIIRICKEENKAYILTPVNTDYLPQLRSGTIVEGYIFLHENLDVPIFDISDYEEGAAGKRGLFCRESWAQGKQDLGESWDGYPSGTNNPVNGIAGVRWKIRYNTAGIWFVLFSNQRVCRFRNNGIDFNTAENRFLYRHAIEISFRVRCARNPFSFTTHQRFPYTLFNQHGTKHHDSPRALQRYNYKYWGEHTNNQTGLPPYYICTKWPLQIQSN